MLLAAADPFYRVDADKLWGSGIRPAIMTDKQLAEELRKGATTYNVLHPSHSDIFGMPLVFWVAVAAVCVGGIAIAAAGPAAGVGAASTTGATGATGVTGATGLTTGATGITATSSTSVAGGLATMQKIGTGLRLSGQVAEVAGVDTPDGLMRAANYMDSSSVGQLAMNVTLGELQNRHNVRLNAKAQDALKEKLERERRRQAALLRQRAAAMRKAGYSAPPAIDWLKYAPIVVPCLILLLQKKG